MTISTNQKPTIYRNLYENTAPGTQQYILNYNHIYKALAAIMPPNAIENVIIW